MRSRSARPARRSPQSSLPPQFLDRTGDHRLARGRGEGDQQLSLEVPDDLQEPQAEHPSDCAEPEQHEQDRGQINARDQLAEAREDAEAEFADREGDRAKGGERRHIHDNVDNAEQRVHDIVDQRDQALAALAHLAQGKAEQRRDNQHRQQIPLRHRADQVRGDHLHQEIDDRQRFRVRHVAGDRLFIQ